MNKKKGIIFGVLAGIIYGCTPILAKLTYLEGSNTMALTLYRNLLSVPFIFAMLKYKGYKKNDFKITAGECKKVAILASLGPTLTALTLYGAYNYISVGMSTTIHYIYPVLVTAACILLFKEKVSSEKIVALILSTTGIMLFFEGNFNIMGVMLALISGVIYAAHILYIDKSGLNNMYPFKLNLYLTIVASVYLFIASAVSGNLTFSLTPKGWLYTALISFLVSFLANTFIFISVKNAGPTITSIVGMLEPITSVVLGILILKEPVSYKIIAACILILAGVLVVTVVKDKPADNSVVATKK